MAATTVGLLLATVAAASLTFGIVLDRILQSRQAQNELKQAREVARRLVTDAEDEVDRIRRERIIKVEEDLERRRKNLENETSERERALRERKDRQDERATTLKRRTERLKSREAALLESVDALDAVREAVESLRSDASSMHVQSEGLLKTVEVHTRDLIEREERARVLDESLSDERKRLSNIVDEQIRKLEHISGLTKDAAYAELVESFKSEARHEAAARVREIREESRLRANREARRIILTAIQRTAANHAIENTVSVVNIPSDEMKGRIIGREGRNIRAFEAASGIEVIVDDTPEAVILSGFNPVRREVARIALERLIQDGRIHPTRIEEVVEKVTSEIEEEITEVGERAIIDLNIQNLHPQLVRLVGSMRYRTSYGQNLLAHSIETARIASLMAAELGLDTSKARRAGLLHDIGKVIEESEDQPHALVGMEVCKKYREDPAVCNAVGAHHDEIEMTGPLSPLVQAADAISGARPGARREALQSYINRLEKLEEMAASFEGVERVFAIQAGREIRVIVNHVVVSDADAEQLAIDISERIQNEMQYPGQVKVTVIRELRSVAIAK